MSSLTSDGAPANVILQGSNVLQQDLGKVNALVTMADEKYISLSSDFESFQFAYVAHCNFFNEGLSNLAASQKHNHLHDLNSFDGYNDLVISSNLISTKMSNLHNSLQELIELLKRIKKGSLTIYRDLQKIDEKVTNSSPTLASSLDSVGERLNEISLYFVTSMEKLKAFQNPFPFYEREIKAYRDALTSPLIYVISKNNFPILNRFCTRNMRVIVKMPRAHYDVIDEALEHLELEQLRFIFRSNPNSDITLFGCKFNLKYAHFTAKMDHIQMSKIEDDLWSEKMGPVKDQGDHECCWAVAAAEIVSTVRHESGHDTSYTEYSIQYLVDFTQPELRRLSRKRAHFCYPLHVKKALDFISKKGIEREDARPFRSDVCEKAVSPPQPQPPNRREYIKEAITVDKVDEVVELLRKHTVVCDIPIFEPEYSQIKDKIYRGPTSRISRYVTQHAGNLVGGGIDNGEKYLRFRSSMGSDFGSDGSMKVSMEVMLMCLSSQSSRIECGVHCDLTMEFPFPLMTNFVYPSLLSKDEEVKRKNDQGSSSSGRPE